MLTVQTGPVANREADPISLEVGAHDESVRAFRLNIVQIEPVRCTPRGAEGDLLTARAGGGDPVAPVETEPEREVPRCTRPHCVGEFEQ